MTGLVSADPRAGIVGAVGVLAATVALPVAVFLAPASEPSAWPLLVVVLVAVAAGRGARGVRDAQPSEPSGGWHAARPHVVRLAGWAGATVALDALWRVTIRWAALWDGHATVIDDASLVVGAGVACAWYAGRKLAGRMHRAILPALQAPELGRLLGVPLLAVGLATVVVAGMAYPAAFGWQRSAASVAVALYALCATVVLQRLRLVALNDSWRHAGRRVQARLTSHWPVWVVVLLAGVVVVQLLWISPVLAPLREATADVPDRIHAWIFGHLAGWEDPVLEHHPLPDPHFEPIPWFARLVRILGVLIVGIVVTVVGLGARRGGLRWSGAGGVGRARATARGDSSPGAASSAHRPYDSVRRLLALVARWLRMLHNIVVAMRRVGETEAPEVRSASQDPAQRPRRRTWRWPSDPREQVKHDYLRVLDQAQRRGLGRCRTQSPLDYASVLRERVPRASRSIDHLTVAFIRARYSQQVITPSDAVRTRQAGRTLREALRSSGR